MVREKKLNFIRKYLVTLFIALILCCLYQGRTVSANNYFDAKVDGITYKCEVTEDGGISVALRETDYLLLLSEINIPENINGFPVTRIDEDFRYYMRYVKRVTIPSSVKSIGKNAFEGCESLKDIQIPDGVTTIEDRAFAGCGMENITIPDSVKSLGKEVFSACCDLETIIIPDGITRIPEGAFEYCYSLKTVRIPKSVIAIDKYAFKYCDELKKIYIPGNVQTIGKGAFLYSSLQDVRIMNGVKSIKENAFSSCYALEKIVIPKSVTEISEDTFDNCYKLKEIIIDEDNLVYSSKECMILDKSETKLISINIDSKKLVTIPIGVKYITQYVEKNLDRVAIIFYAGTYEEFMNIRVIETNDESPSYHPMSESIGNRVSNIEPIIEKQPVSMNCNLSNISNQKLSVTANRYKRKSDNEEWGKLTYQWFRNKTDDTTTGTKIEGATDSWLNISDAPLGETYYYCVVTLEYKYVYRNVYFSFTSDVAKITVEQETIPENEEVTPCEKSSLEASIGKEMKI